MKSLCIDCLLLQNSHKNHEVLNIEKSMEKEDAKIKIIEEKLNHTKAKISKE